jgi:hypothetical protein
MNLLLVAGTRSREPATEAKVLSVSQLDGARPMGKGILLWLLGVPIPVIILLWLLFGH